MHIEPEGGFTVTVPTLPGCITYGKNLNETIEMAKEAIELYIEVYLRNCHNLSFGNSEVQKISSQYLF